MAIELTFELFRQPPGSCGKGARRSPKALCCYWYKFLSYINLLYANLVYAYIYLLVHRPNIYIYYWYKYSKHKGPPEALYIVPLYTEMVVLGLVQPCDLTRYGLICITATNVMNHWSSGEGLEETWIHIIAVFCIFRFQSIWVAISGDNPSFRVNKRKTTHAWLRLANVCCSVLQCVAVCCSVLQCVAACCSVS